MSDVTRLFNAQKENFPRWEILKDLIEALSEVQLGNDAVGSDTADDKSDTYLHRAASTRCTARLAKCPTTHPQPENPTPEGEEGRRLSKHLP